MTEKWRNTLVLGAPSADITPPSIILLQSAIQQKLEQSDLLEVEMVLVEARKKRNTKWGKKVATGGCSRSLLVEARTDHSFSGSSWKWLGKEKGEKTKNKRNKKSKRKSERTRTEKRYHHDYECYILILILLLLYFC